MRKVVSFLLTFLLLISSFPMLHAEAEGFAGGAGTPEDPYLIETAAQLQMLAKDNSNSNKSFKLVKDIDLTGIEWESIPQFSGTFDGANHLIVNLTAKESEKQFFVGGLFRTISGNKAKVRNVGLVNVNVSTTYDANPIGALANTIDGGATVENVFTHGTVYGGSLVGGLAGNVRFGATVTNSFARVNVTGFDTVGGLIGKTQGSVTITDTYSKGSVTHTVGKMNPRDGIVGGLVGEISSGTDIIRAYAATPLTGGAKSKFGGLVGALEKQGPEETPPEEPPASPPPPGEGSAVDVSYDNVLYKGGKDAVGSIGRSTEELTAGSAFIEMENERWVFTKGEYPHLRSFPDVLLSLTVNNKAETNYSILKTKYTYNVKSDVATATLSGTTLLERSFLLLNNKQEEVAQPALLVTGVNALRVKLRGNETRLYDVEFVKEAPPTPTPNPTPTPTPEPTPVPTPNPAPTRNADVLVKDVVITRVPIESINNVDTVTISQTKEAEIAKEAQPYTIRFNEDSARYKATIPATLTKVGAATVATKQANVTTAGAGDIAIEETTWNDVKTLTKPLTIRTNEKAIVAIPYKGDALPAVYAIYQDGTKAYLPSDKGTQAVTFSLLKQATVALVADPYANVTVKLDGTSKVGQTLKAVLSSDIEGVSYAWYRNGERLTTETGTTYTVVEADEKQSLEVRVTLPTARIITAQTTIIERTCVEKSTIGCVRVSLEVPLYTMKHGLLNNTGRLLDIANDVEVQAIIPAAYAIDLKGRWILADLDGATYNTPEKKYLQAVQNGRNVIWKNRKLLPKQVGILLINETLPIQFYNNGKWTKAGTTKATDIWNVFIYRPMVYKVSATEYIIANPLVVQFFKK